MALSRLRKFEESQLSAHLAEVREGWLCLLYLDVENTIQPQDVNQCWKSFLYKIRQVMIACFATSGRCKRALWDSSGRSPLFQMMDLNQTQQFGSNSLELLLVRPKPHGFTRGSHA